MKHKVVILLLCFGFLVPVYGQENQPIVAIAHVIDGDTLPVLQLKEVEILSLSVPRRRSERKKLTKLIKNVKRVYPYSKLAGMQLRKYEDILQQTESKKERREVMKQAEKEITEKYDELKLKRQDRDK